MKKLFYCLLIFWSHSTMAFFVNSEILERTNKKIHIEINNNEIQIEILETIKNNSEIPQTINYYEPLTNTTKDINFFVESDKLEFNLLEKKDQLTQLFKQAQKHKDFRFFRLANQKWEKTLESNSFEIPPNENVEVKLKYKKSLDFIHDFFFSEIFLNDEISTQKMEIILSINRSQKIYHFLPIFTESTSTIKEKNKIIWIWKKENVIPKQNFSFFFSEIQKPILKFSSFDADYFAHFISPIETQKFEKILILVDKSGSLYGSAWNRIGDILQKFLNKIEQSIQIKLIFFNENETEILNPEFKNISQNLKKQFFEIFESKKPTGKTNFRTIFEAIEKTKVNPKMGVLLIGDFNNFEITPSEITKIQKWNVPFFTLDFSKNKNDTDLLTLISGGKTQKLFKTPTEFIESDEFWNKWNTQIIPLKPTKFQKNNPQQKEFLPKIKKNISIYLSPFFTSRNFEKKTVSFSELENFIPRIWGSQKIATILRNFLNQPPTENDINALLSIARTFGIKTNFFNESTSKKELQKTLKNLSQKSIWQEIFNLENPDIISPKTSARFGKNLPFYLSQERWQSINFYEKKNPQTLIEIAPFSEAQKNLFLNFPEIFAEVFGISDKIDFCHNSQRCISLQNESRKNAKPSDLFFWKNFHPNHWSNDYLKILVDKNILSISKEGNAFPEQKVTRGEFIKMVTQYFYADQWKNFEKTNFFTDLDPHTELAKIANFLSEKEIIKGFPDKTFRPHQNLTRAESVKILLAINGIKQPENWESPNELPFPDILGWEKFWVLKAFELKMIQGYNDGRFWSHRSITRGQASKLLIEAKQKIKNK